MTIVQSVVEGSLACLNHEVAPTPGHILQPVQVALQDGDLNTGWRPFKDGIDTVRVTIDIVMPSNISYTETYLILTVSDLPCQGGGLVIYIEDTRSNIAEEEVSRCSGESHFRECAFVNQDNGGHVCTFSCRKECYGGYLTVFVLFQKLKWKQYDPIIKDLMVEYY